MIAPDVHDWLFLQKATVDGVSVTHPSLTALYVVGQRGLVVYMFVVGLAFNVKIFTDHIRHAAAPCLPSAAASSRRTGL